MSLSLASACKTWTRRNIFTMQPNQCTASISSRTYLDGVYEVPLQQEMFSAADTALGATQRTRKMVAIKYKRLSRMALM